MFFLFLIVPLFVYSRPVEQKKTSLEDKLKDFHRYIEGQSVEERDKKTAQFYDMPEDVEILEVTDRVEKSDYIEKNVNNFERRYFIFKYPSDGLSLFGFISFVPTAKCPKTIVLIRGGNRGFGIPHPGRSSYSKGPHTYVGTTIRDGINPGRDEYGGCDVNDVINLVKFMPSLKYLIPSATIDPMKCYLIGVSRGAMEMMLALSRSQFLQERVIKAVSAVGLLNMNTTLKYRPDLESMFYREFQLKNSNREKWIARRDPIQHVEKIRRNLPMLLIEGNNDIRSDPTQSESMYAKLKSQGHDVTRWVHEDGHKFHGVDDKLNAWLDTD